MEREFWKESAASLRESISEHKRDNKRLTNKKSSEKRYKKIYKEGYKEGYKESYEPKDLLKPLRILENAYGRYVFGTKNDKYIIMVSRKSEFKEETFDNSREKLNEARLNEKKITGGRLFADSHKKEESAVIFEESFKNAPAERIFNDLKIASKKGNKLTLNEMLPKKYDVEKKVFQNIKASVEMLNKNKKDIIKSDEIPFFKRAFNSFADSENNIDEGQNEESNDKSNNENND